MKTLTIRRVPDRVHAQLRRSAAEKGISMEEEARRRLLASAEGEAAAIAPPYDPARAAQARDRLWKMFEGLENRALVDEFLAEKRVRARKELGK